MTYQTALNDVLRVAEAGLSTCFRWTEIARWPEGALDALVRAGALWEIEHARSVECDECEEACLEDVEFIGEGDGLRAYVVCRQRDDIGRVRVPLQRLRQWRVDLAGLAETLARLIGATGAVEELVPDQLWWLGRVVFRAGRMDAFLARGTTLAGGLDAIGGAPRFQACAHAVLLTLSDISPDDFPGKVPIALSRALLLGGEGLTIDVQCIEDEVARGLGAPTYRVPNFPTPPGTTWEQVRSS